MGQDSCLDGSKSAFQKPETATERVVTTEFLGELFPMMMGISASDGT